MSPRNNADRADPVRRSVRWAIRLLAIAFTMAYVCRVEIGNGFSTLIGDPLDGLIQSSIMQHWYNVFSGLEPWDTTAYFFPHTGTLGYNDGFFINGILFSGFRIVGADPFLASELASDTIRAIGFVAFRSLCRRCSRLWIRLGAAGRGAVYAG